MSGIGGCCWIWGLLLLYMVLMVLLLLLLVFFLNIGSVPADRAFGAPTSGPFSTAAESTWKSTGMSYEVSQLVPEVWGRPETPPTIKIDPKNVPEVDVDASKFA